MNGVRVDVARLTGNSAGRPNANEALPAMLATLMPGVDTKKLEETIRADLETQDANNAPRARAARAIGLALGSPEFQKR
jgi:hypothetical protein